MTTVNTLVLGPNSKHIAYNSLAVPATLFPTVVAALAAGGWEFFDAVTTTDWIFRAPMVDAATVYKYVRISMNSTTLGLEVYESWNAVTHAGLNLAYMGPDPQVYRQRLNFESGGSIFVFATPRWLVLYSRIPEGTGKFIYGSGSGSAWSGCFEIEKGNVGETTGQYPRFAWVNGQTFSGEQQIAGAAVSYPSTSNANAEYHHWSVPRSRNGATGQAASKNCVVSSITIPMVVRVDPTYQFRCQTNQGYPFSEQREENAKTSGYTSTPGSPFSAQGAPGVSQPYAYDVLSGVRGAFLGLKLISQSAGSLMDILSLRVSTVGKPSVFGTPVSHSVLGNTLNNTRVAVPL